MTANLPTRYAGSVSLGALVTFSLLLLMQHLIATGENSFVEATKVRLPAFNVARTPIPPETHREPPDPPSPPAASAKNS